MDQDEESKYFDSEDETQNLNGNSARDTASSRNNTHAVDDIDLLDY